MGSTESVVGRLTPPFRKDRVTWRQCRSLVERLMAADPSRPDADQEIERVRKDGFHADARPEHQAAFAAVISVLCDLRLQGWSFIIQRACIALQRAAAHIDGELERQRIRRMHTVNRDAQLLRQSVRDFVREMEKKRLGPHGWVSIFSLMRDGRELADKLRHFQSIDSEAKQILHLRTVFRPYFQVVSEEGRCEQTGLLLNDVWRYFRLTWTNEYQSVPGRNLMLLVRDAAVPHHPVIGIAALASPVVHLGVRDEWIGWAPRQFVNTLREKPTDSWAKWVESQLRQLVADVYTSDLVRDGVIGKAELASPTEDTIAALEEESDRARQQHHLHPTKEIHKSPKREPSEADWLERAETHLFRWKRCVALAELLRAKLRLKHAGFAEPSKACLEKTLSTSEGRLAIETIRKHVKAIHIGNDVLDVCVCGAVAPYADLIGGKLVAMLLTSPEVVRYYAQRYGKRSSIIASSMAGRRITRRPRLTALTTTSLYGAEPNQYTRLKIPVSELGQAGNGVVEFRKIGLTQGQGSYHFSAATVDAIEVLISQMSDSRTVNSIFGEGVSPRLRKIRAGLDACGFPSDAVLTHGLPRVVYGVFLTEKPRHVLLSRAKRSRYLMDQTSPEATTAAIADFWMRRWCVRRAQRPDIVERVEQHTLVSPVNHGARVPLPRVFDEEPLFFHQD